MCGTPISLTNAGSKFLTAVLIKVLVFWDVTPLQPVKGSSLLGHYAMSAGQHAVTSMTP